MPLRILSRVWKSIGLRMMLWYSVIFAISSLAIFLIAFLMLSSWLREQDKILITSKLQQYQALYQKNGLQAIKEELERSGGSDPFFIRIAGPGNQTLLKSIPNNLYDDEDHSQSFRDQDLEKNTRGQQWSSITSIDEDEVLTLASANLPDGNVIQTGRTSEDNEEVLEHFQNFFLAIFCAILITGLFAGSLLTYRLLHPVRNIIGATQSIIETGRIESRIPFHRSSGELQELVRLFNSMLDKIESLIRGMKESLDNVAHELKTPVSRLRGAAETALQNPSGHSEALADCLEESDRITTMLDTLMDISEAETGTMKLRLQDLNLSLFLEDIADLYRYVAEEKNVHLLTDLPDELHVEVDRSRLQQAIANLLDNAIKYTPSGGTVTMSAQKGEHGVTVSIADTGVGIAPEELAHVWDRLYRSDKSRSQPGLGLGLSFVKAIVEAHNGSIEVSSTPGHGSIFRIFLR